MIMLWTGMDVMSSVKSRSFFIAKVNMYINVIFFIETYIPSCVHTGAISNLHVFSITYTCIVLVDKR